MTRPAVPAPREPSEDVAGPVLSDEVMAVLNGVPGMVGYWDRDLRNRLANDAYVEMFGFTPEQMRGRHISEVLGQAVYEANLPFMRRALAGEEQLFDRTLVDTEGRTHYVQASYIPDQRDSGVHGFFVLATDITARVVTERALETSADQYRALARSMPSGFVLLFDTDLRFAVADGVELGAFGFSREQLEGRTLHEAFPDELASELEPRYRAALAGSSVNWVREVGSRTFRLTAGPVRPVEGPVVSAMVTAFDITEERRNGRTWAALHSIATDVARNAPLEAIAHDVATALVDIFAVDLSAVARFVGPGTAEIVRMAPEHLPTLSTTLRYSPGDGSAIARVQETGQAALAHYSTGGGEVAGQLVSGGVQVGAAAPIHSHGELWGVIAIASRHPDGIDHQVTERLNGFAELVEIALGSTSAWDALSRQATLDDLTGLPNRRLFREQLDQEVVRARRHPHPLSVALMDLDHFKSVNDRFGHPVGDRVLSELGQRIRAASREGELVARLGGEEFGWIMPETDLEAAAVAAERLRRAVSAEPFPVAGRVSISIGVCSSDHCDGVDALIAGADQALYAAKRDGRDRVARHLPSP